MHTKTWYVRVYLSEQDATTKARAVLATDDSRTQLHGEGAAHAHPGEPNVPEIGDEIATARALAALAQVLNDTARADVDGVLCTQ